MALRTAASQLEFVKTGDARVRVTGNVALADEEFATVAQGVVEGMIGSILLISLWLFLAVRSWRLIVPILLTLGLGLLLTLFFAAAAVGTLNVVSIGFGILFVGIAVDFAIQFCVRYREMRHAKGDPATALAATGQRVGGQILVAAGATAAGFLAFVPTDFRGVAELGLIAGVGMLIAFVCTVTFLPALITLFQPHGERAEIGFRWAAHLDHVVCDRRRPVLIGFAALALLGLLLLPRLSFDADPLHTKNPDTEAMRTLYDLMDSPLTNPFTIDILATDPAAAGHLAEHLRTLPLVSDALSINTFVPRDQPAKLAQISDAATILGPTLALHPASAPVAVDDLRAAAKKALDQIVPALPKLPPDHPLNDLAGDLRRLAAAPDATVLAANRSLTGFLPDELDRLRVALEAQPVTLRSLPPDLTRDWVLPDGRARVQVLPKAEARNSKGLAAFVAEVETVAPDAGGSAVTIEETSRHDRGIVPVGRGRCSRGDHPNPVRRVATRARCLPGPGAVIAVVVADRDHYGIAADATELREYHRPAAVAGGWRVLQHLFCDELASRAASDARFGHGARDPVFGPDYRHRFRVAGALRASRHRQHGGAVAGQPRLHAGRDPRLHPGAAGLGSGPAVQTRLGRLQTGRRRERLVGWTNRRAWRQLYAVICCGRRRCYHLRKDAEMVRIAGVALALALGVEAVILEAITAGAIAAVGF